MHSILNFAETAYIEAHNLMPLLRDYSNPRDFISRLVKNNELIRLKNGFFVIAEKIKNAPVPYEQIANLMYGPSYISLERALSSYSAIPEGVYVVTSVCMSKSNKFHTPLGEFEYVHLSPNRYSIGINQMENHAGNYLIATPEKALADLVHLKSKDLSPSDLATDLLEARRIDESFLKQLDKKHLLEISENYRSKSVRNLVNAIGLL